MVRSSVAEAAKVTKNSEKATEPIVVRGSLPRASSVPATIGPHPPPPIESQKPPARPRGSRCLSLPTCTERRHAFARMTTPINRRYVAMKGFTTSPGTLVRTYAPAIAPMTPGMRSFLTNDAMTFFRRQWFHAENAVATTSAVCTLALAAAGGTPKESSSVVALTP
jgi:hypothetical protein